MAQTILTDALIFIVIITPLQRGYFWSTGQLTTDVVALSRRYNNNNNEYVDISPSVNHINNDNFSSQKPRQKQIIP